MALTVMTYGDLWVIWQTVIYQCMVMDDYGFISCISIAHIVADFFLVGKTGKSGKFEKKKILARKQRS